MLLFTSYIFVMFFTVHFGDAESAVFNSICKCRVMLERLKTVCGCKVDDLIDLADMQAVVQKVADIPDTTYVCDVLQPRGNYIPVKYTRRVDESGTMCKEYFPLLNGLEQINPDFLSRLSNRKINPDAYVRETKENLKSMMKKKGGNNNMANKPKPSNANLTTSPGQRKQSTRN